MLKKVSYYLLCTLICLVTLTFIAQGQSQVRFEIISERDGLSSNDIFSNILQNKQGYLWFGTIDGLNRYDGYSFKVYKNIPGDSTTLPSNTITSLVEDTHGLIWIGYLNTPMITSLDPVTQKLRSYRITPDSMATYSLGVSAMFVENDSTVWIGLDRIGLFMLDTKRSESTFIGPLPDLPFRLHDTQKPNVIIGFYKDSRGEFWLTTGAGLYNFNKTKKEFTRYRSKTQKNVLGSETYGVLLPDSNNGIWFCSWGWGLNYFNTVTKEWKQFLFEPMVLGVSNITNGLAWKSANELWVTTNGFGLGYFKIDEEKFEFLSGPEIQQSTLASTAKVYKASNGVIWFTTTEGINKLNPPPEGFNFFKLNAPKPRVKAPTQKISSLYQDDSLLFVGTNFADGLHVINKNNGKETVHSFEFFKSDPYLVVTDLIKDSKGTIWVLTRDFIYHFHKDLNKLVKFYQPELPEIFKKRSPYFECIYESSDGTIWIGSIRNGLYKYDRITKKYTTLNPSRGDSIDSKSVQGIVEDEAGNIWLASNFGINVYNPKDNTFNYAKNEPENPKSLINNFITDIRKSPAGDIWITTKGGISQHRIGTPLNQFNNWTTNEGLPTNVIRALSVDRAGMVWVLGGSKLLAIDPTSASIRAFSSDMLTTYYTNDLGDDGFGNMYFNVQGGCYIFSPEQLLKTKVNPPVLAITSFKVFNHEIQLEFDSAKTATIELPYDQNFISVEFAALNFKRPNENKYSYFMQGVDKTWSYNTTKRSVNYPSLPPGTYTFHVRSDDVANVSQEGLTLVVHISPPFWKEWWFVSLEVFFSCALLLGMYSYHLKQTRKESEFKRRLAEVKLSALRAQMSPHFIFNSLNSINRYISKSDIETASIYLTKFAKLIRSILDNSKHQVIPLEQDLVALKIYIDLEAMRFNQQFDYSVKLQGNIDPALIHIPPMMIQPFVENAIWHGLLHIERKGLIDIQIEKREGFLFCVIQDNGIGRKKAQQLKNKFINQEKSYGLKITSERLALISDKTEFQSTVEIMDLEDDMGNATGTKVVLKILCSDN